MADTTNRDTAKDMLLQFYQEESNQARHHEEQRSTAANITFAIAATLLGVISGVAAINGRVSWTLFPLTFGLVVLSGVGSVLSKKHFERSMHNYARARSYRDCLLALFTDQETKGLFGDRLKKIKGIADLEEAKKKQQEAKEAGKPAEKGKYALARQGDTGKLDTEDLQKEIYLLDKLNPMDPEVYVTPLENAKHTWLWQYLASPYFDLYKLWNVIYLFLLLAGLLLSGFAVYDFIHRNDEKTKEPIDIRIVTPTPTPMR